MALMRPAETGGVGDAIAASQVQLRRPEFADYEAWARLRARSRAFLTPWEPAWAPDELTRNAYRRRVRRYQREARDGGAAPFFVWRVEDGALVGGCNLNTIKRGVQQSAAIGYWVGEPYRRRGYTRQAVCALLTYAFEALDLHRVEAACIPTNEPSRLLLESVGFRREGVARAYLRINGAWRDHMLYAIVRGDPIWLQST